MTDRVAHRIDVNPQSDCEKIKILFVNWGLQNVRVVLASYRTRCIS